MAQAVADCLLLKVQKGSGPPTVVKVFCILWGEAYHPGAKSTLGDAKLAGQGEDPRHCQRCVHTRILPDQCILRFGPLRGRFNIGKIVPFFQLQVKQAPHRDNDGCPSRPRPEATQLNLPCMILASLKLPSLHWSPGECLQLSETMHGLFKSLSWFLANFHLTGRDGWSPHCVYCLIFWGFIFLVLDPWAGVLGVGLGPLTLQKGPPSFPSWCSASICGFGVILFPISAPSTTLNMTSSFYP